MVEVIKRRRRTPDMAKEEILDAAEAILLEHGPADLKFQEISAAAKISKSTAHHHFGSLEEIHKALAFRVLQRLINDLSKAFSEGGPSAEQNVETAVQTVYAIIASERNAKILCWIILSTDTEQLACLAEPLTLIRQMVSKKLTDHMPPKAARKVAPHIIYQVAITAIGEGLIGNRLKPAMSEGGKQPEGKSLLNQMVLNEISDHRDDG